MLSSPTTLSNQPKGPRADLWTDCQSSPRADHPLSLTVHAVESLIPPSVLGLGASPEHQRGQEAVKDRCGLLKILPHLLVPAEGKSVCLATGYLVWNDVEKELNKPHLCYDTAAVKSFSYDLWVCPVCELRGIYFISAAWQRLLNNIRWVSVASISVKGLLLHGYGGTFSPPTWRIPAILCCFLNPGK